MAIENTTTVKAVTSGTQLTSVGTVKTVVGLVKAVDANGAERVLQVGDKVYASETIVTSADGGVIIEFPNGSFLDLPRSAHIMLDPEIYSATASKSIEQEAASEADRIARAIAEGRDPNAVADPAAAGGETGDEGTTTPLVVDFDNTQGNVTSGFPTGTFALAFPPPQEELPPIIETPAAAVPPTEIIATLLDINIDPDAKGVPEGGDVVYTVTLDKISSEDVTVTLSNGVVITIAAGELTGSSEPIPVQADDPYVDPSTEAVFIETMTGGGGNEVLNFDSTPVSFNVDDTIDTTTATITTNDVPETATAAVFNISLNNPPDPSWVGEVTAQVLVGATTYDVVIDTDGNGVLNIPFSDDDVYNDADSITATVTGVTGGNYEAVVGSTATATITEVIDTTIVTLEGEVTSGSTATVTATVSNAPQSDLTINLVGEDGTTVVGTIIISAGFTTGETEVPTTAGVSYTVSVGSTSGGNYEALDTTDTADVGAPPNILNLSFTANTNQTTQFVLVEFSQNGNTYSRVIDLTAQGQQALAYTYAFDVGFNIDPSISYDFSMKYLGNDAGTGGQVLNLFNLVVENTSIDVANGNIKLGDGGSAPDGFEATIDTALTSYTLLNGDFYNRIDAPNGTATGTDDNDAIDGSNSVSIGDNISGGAGDDLIMADRGNDIIDGGTGNDGLTGGVGSDTITGGDGNDLLSGGVGNDILNGGDGIDFLYGGVGNDNMTGGEGKDTFVWLSNDANTPATDTVTDFVIGAGGDVLDLSSLLQGENSGNIGGFLTSATLADGNTTLVFDTNGSALGGSTQTIVLENVTFDGLDIIDNSYNTTEVLNQLLQDGNLKVDS